MKKTVLAVLIAACVAAAAGYVAGRQQVAPTADTHDHASANAERKSPLLVRPHGGRGSASITGEITFYGYARWCRVMRMKGQPTMVSA